MANWKHTVVVKDLMGFWKAPATLDGWGRTYADRVRQAVGLDGDAELEAILVTLAGARTVGVANAALDRLYDWADHGHRLWIESV